MKYRNKLLSHREMTSWTNKVDSQVFLMTQAFDPNKRVNISVIYDGLTRPVIKGLEECIWRKVNENSWVVNLPVKCIKEEMYNEGVQRVSH